MTTELLDQFDQEVEVFFRDERYLVRDNGAVCRLPRSAGRRRKLDNRWTFGSVSRQKGYTMIGSIAVHQIVATAFHGPAPSSSHVVDHIDTNRRNNRQENLRWVTRLENILLNPVTCARLVGVYGSLDNFFNDPSDQLTRKPNYDWMRAVTKEEAEAARSRLSIWAETGRVATGGQLGEWLYKRPDSLMRGQSLMGLRRSLTPMALQRRWKTLCAFPYCPDAMSEGAFREYKSKLGFGTTFARNEYGKIRTVIASGTDDQLIVLATGAVGAMHDWAVFRVSREAGQFVHEYVFNFHTLQGALKVYCRESGEPFEETIDDAM